jgi:hypothetical protein
MSGDTSDTQSSPDQFASGDTLVDGCAGARPGIGKSTRLIEWVREQHDDDAVRVFIDPAADPDASETREFDRGGDA